MNREMAIDWVRSMFKKEYWPKTTKGPFPHGWRWVVSNRPYQKPTYKLVNSKFDEINKDDI